jgi:mycoredoxin
MSAITMYGADWCRDCRRAKSYLDERAIPFVYIDLEETPDEMQTVLAYNDGRTNIPVVVFADGSHLTEPTNDELADKLASVDA